MEDLKSIRFLCKQLRQAADTRDAISPGATASTFERAAADLLEELFPKAFNAITDLACSREHIANLEAQLAEAAEHNAALQELVSEISQLRSTLALRDASLAIFSKDALRYTKVRSALCKVSLDSIGRIKSPEGIDEYLDTHPEIYIESFI